MSKERELLIGAVEWMQDLKYVWADTRDSGDRILLDLVADINKIEQLLNNREHIVDVTDKVEPVAWMYDWTNEIGELSKGIYVGSHKASHLYELENLEPLYTAPPKREPLSFDDLNNMWCGNPIDFARTIESIHGIGGEDER